MGARICSRPSERLSIDVYCLRFPIIAATEFVDERLAHSRAGPVPRERADVHEQLTTAAFRCDEAKTSFVVPATEFSAECHVQ